MKTKGLKMLSGILVLGLIFGLLGQSVNAKGLNDLFGKDIRIGTKTQVELEEVKITYSLLWNMNNEYSLGVKIENKSIYSIKNWAAIIPIEGEVLSVIGADLLEIVEEGAKVKHGSLNSTISPGKSVSFTINIHGKLETMPTNFILIKGQDSPAVGITSSLTIDSLWKGTFTGTIDIKNNGEIIEGNWQIEFDYENEFFTFSGGSIISKENGHYIVKPYLLDTVLRNGETFSCGFMVVNGFEEAQIHNLKIIKHIYSEEMINDDWIDDDSFIKEPTEADVDYNEHTEERYVRNQILLGVMLGTDREIIESLSAEIGAEIVGYVPVMEMYQLEFYDSKDYYKLYDVIYELKEYSFVNYASLNYASEINYMYYPSDPYNDKAGDEWNINNPEGGNWGLEALRVPEAWDRRNEFAGTPKIGIYDTMFDEKHPDLHFKKTINNNLFIKKDSHGTHVAGIIGAEFDNGKGVAGVATNVDMYGYSVYGTSSYLSSFSQQLNTLVRNGIKAINISYGYYEYQTYLASIGDPITIAWMQNESEVLSNNLKQLFLSGYDFLIINAAGNASNLYYKKEGLVWKEYTEEEKGSRYLRYAQAKYANTPNLIDDELVKNHILVVGAAEYEVVNGVKKYYVCDFSGRGDRVDIYAPGRNIYSTVNTDGLMYDYKSGTSMATPYITGIAALIWQANPNLTALQVKNIIIDSKGQEVKERKLNDVFFMPDAEKCISKALSITGPWEDSNMPRGSIKGKVTDINGNPLSGINVALVRTSFGQANLSEYYYMTTTNSLGEYETSVVAGTYEINAYDSKSKYLPVKVNEISVEPEEVKNVLTIKMGPLPTSVILLRASTIQGKVYDAINGNVIPDASVNIRSGWNKVDGEYCKPTSVHTNNQGYFEITTGYGNYTVEIKKEGYIIGHYNVVSIKNEAGAYESMVLTPELSDDEYRIVLTWDAEPRDLDSHLMYYDNSNTELMHVYYASPVGYINGIKVAQLDVDDTSGYGPETVTITLKTDILQNGGYFRYYVHLFAGSSTLAASNATVRVYAGNNLIETYYVPTYLGTNEVNWQVFKITKNGIQKVISGQ